MPRLDVFPEVVEEWRLQESVMRCSVPRGLLGYHECGPSTFELNHRKFARRTFGTQHIWSCQKQINSSSPPETFHSGRYRQRLFDAGEVEQRKMQARGRFRLESSAVSARRRGCSQVEARSDNDVHA